MLNLMVDKETLALHENAVIVQIGLVVFDGNFNPVTELDLKIDVTASLLDGFEADSGTARGFWAKQPAAVIRSVLYDGPRLPPRDAARVLDKWLKDVFKGKDFAVWANGILFDIPKMDNLFKRYGMKPLTDRTRYNLVYDFRTLRAAAKQLYPLQYAHANELLKNDSLHNALADCHWQVAMLSAVMAILGGQYEIMDDTPSDLDIEPVTGDNGEVEHVQVARATHAPDMTAIPVDQRPGNPTPINEESEKRWEDEDPQAEEFLEHVYGAADKDNPAERKMLAEEHIPPQEFNRDNVDNT